MVIPGKIVTAVAIIASIVTAAVALIFITGGMQKAAVTQQLEREKLNARFARVEAVRLENRRANRAAARAAHRFQDFGHVARRLDFNNVPDEPQHHPEPPHLPELAGDDSDASGHVYAASAA